MLSGSDSSIPEVSLCLPHVTMSRYMADKAIQVRRDLLEYFKARHAGDGIAARAIVATLREMTC